MICPKCQHHNLDGELICANCGAPLIDLSKEQTTRTLDNADNEEGVPRWGLAKFNGALVLVVVENGREFVFDANALTEIMIGRKNPDTGEIPDVDLSAYDALERGVSRNHATILKRDGALHIVDLGSANGTYLNGQRLVAKQPRILRDGDDIRLGRLVIRANFRA